MSYGKIVLVPGIERETVPLNTTTYLSIITDDNKKDVLEIGILQNGKLIEEPVVIPEKDLIQFINYAERKYTYPIECPACGARRKDSSTCPYCGN
jgi:hypothetical protein